MADLIDRQATIDALERRKDKNAKGDIGGFYNKIIQNDIDALIQLPPAQPEQRWIPCSEGLPYVEYGESDTVLTTCGYRDVEDTSIRWIKLLYFNGGNWCYPTGGTYGAKVYAWMPLPKPWKGGQDG